MVRWLLALSFLPLTLAAVPKKNTATKKPLVFVQKAVTGKIFDLLSYPAQLSSRVDANVLSETEGVVEKILAPLGKRVRKGTPLFRVKHTDPIFEYAPVIVRAPVSGIVGQVLVTEGSRVNKGDRLAKVTDPKQLRIQIELTPSDIKAVHSQLKGDLTIPGVSKPIPVQVLGVSPIVDPETGTASAELRPLQKNSQLIPGRVGSVHFRVREHEGIQLPEAAVRYRNNKTYLRLVEEGKAKKVEVDLGPMRRGLVEIQKGIEPGALVIVRASQFISDGEEVEVKVPRRQVND